VDAGFDGLGAAAVGGDDGAVGPVFESAAGGGPEDGGEPVDGLADVDLGVDALGRRRVGGFEADDDVQGGEVAGEAAAADAGDGRADAGPGDEMDQGGGRAFVGVADRPLDQGEERFLARVVEVQVGDLAIQPVVPPGGGHGDLDVRSVEDDFDGHPTTSLRGSARTRPRA